MSSVASDYLHVEVQVTQTSKRIGEPCGDVVVSERNEAHTTLACVDGVGSGMRARIAARMCASRLVGLLQNGFSFRDAFTAVAETMNRWRDPTKPYAAFTVARVHHDGVATALSYDAPPPLLVSPRQALPLEGKPLRWGKALVTETECQLSPSEGLLLLSDGSLQGAEGR